MIEKGGSTAFLEIQTEFFVFAYLLFDDVGGFFDVCDLFGVDHFPVIQREEQDAGIQNGGFMTELACLGDVFDEFDFFDVFEGDRYLLVIVFDDDVVVFDFDHVFEFGQSQYSQSQIEDGEKQREYQSDEKPLGNLFGGVVFQSHSPKQGIDGQKDEGHDQNRDSQHRGSFE